MCLLVVQSNHKGTKRSTLIPKSMFNNVWDSNPHGFGLGYFDKDQKPVMIHSIDKDKAWTEYEKHWKEFRGEMIVHWRWATQGVRDETNCHPFLTETPTPSILGHNGIIGHLPSDVPTEWSDTNWFARNLGKLLKHPATLGHKDDEEVMTKHLGGSRLAILEPNQKLHTWNFPIQAQYLAEYGLFSMTYIRDRTVAKTWNHGSFHSWEDNWAPYNSGSRSNSSNFYQDRPAKHKALDYISPKQVDKEVFRLPHTFWLFEVLETNAFLDFEVVMRRFHNRFGRFPTSQEMLGAFALTTKNRNLSPKKKNEPKEEPILHGL